MAGDSDGFSHAVIELLAAESPCHTNCIDMALNLYEFLYADWELSFGESNDLGTRCMGNDKVSHFCEF